MYKIYTATKFFLVTFQNKNPQVPFFYTKLLLFVWMLHSLSATDTAFNAEIELKTCNSVCVTWLKATVGAQVRPSPGIWGKDANLIEHNAVYCTQETTDTNFSSAQELRLRSASHVSNEKIKIDKSHRLNYRRKWLHRNFRCTKSYESQMKTPKRSRSHEPPTDTDDTPGTTTTPGILPTRVGLSNLWSTISTGTFFW